MDDQDAIRLSSELATGDLNRAHKAVDELIKLSSKRLTYFVLRRYEGRFGREGCFDIVQDTYIHLLKTSISHPQVFLKANLMTIMIEHARGAAYKISKKSAHRLVAEEHYEWSRGLYSFHPEACISRLEDMLDWYRRFVASLPRKQAVVANIYVQAALERQEIPVDEVIARARLYHSTELTTHGVASILREIREKVGKSVTFKESFQP